MWAIKKARCDVVELYYKKKLIDVTGLQEYDVRKRTALHLAVEHGQLVLVKSFCNSDSWMMREKDYDEQTPLQTARRKLHEAPKNDEKGTDELEKQYRQIIKYLEKYVD